MVAVATLVMVVMVMAALMLQIHMVAMEEDMEDSVMIHIDPADPDVSHLLMDIMAPLLEADPLLHMIEDPLVTTVTMEEDQDPDHLTIATEEDQDHLIKHNFNSILMSNYISNK